MAERALDIDLDVLRSWQLPKPPADGDKQARGDVLVVGGSAEIPGAVLLAAQAALRAGAGRVQVATVQSAAPHLAIALPEARVIGLDQDAQGELAADAGRPLAAELKACRALVLGPGMRSENAAARIYLELTRQPSEATVVLDAAALRLLSNDGSKTRAATPLIATPHAGEMATLLGCTREHVQQNRAMLALEAARQHDVVLVLKGAETYIAAPDGRTFRNTAGNPGLATAGSGDTLAGIIGGLCARGADAVQAAVWGVWLHAMAGERLAEKIGHLGYLARELAAEVPQLLDLPLRDPLRQLKS
ncbi:MAG TPA: NAD(P)H-hydrate dehydratase [Polyangiaceae bacterium]|nr:NAD(P)H-hydrate dehydratase [Polyangiaceae bacterium]